MKIDIEINPYNIKLTNAKLKIYDSFLNNQNVYYYVP